MLELKQHRTIGLDMSCSNCRDNWSLTLVATASIAADVGDDGSMFGLSVVGGAAGVTLVMIDQYFE